MPAKKIAILGSTGSIGRSSLQVIRHLGLEVSALAAHSNVDLLEQQAREFKPEIIAVFDETKALELQKRLPGIPVVAGMEGLEELAAHPSSDFVIAAISGTQGIRPTIAAIKAGKTIGLANKEVLVSAGEYIKTLGAKLLPIDSEHSALHQCLTGKGVRRLILTASGGPFRTHSTEELEKITVESALQHPTWTMGSKVTIDCSTLMNKGLEVIEAYHLFDIPIEQIEVIVHPQSLIHSMVEYIDGSILAQISEPSMTLPIQYALTYPERKQGLLKPFDFAKFSKMEFQAPDLQKFPCLDLAFSAVKEGGSLPCYMNGANEVLVERFLDGQIHWLEIPKKLEQLMERHQVEQNLDLEKILEVDTLSREEAAHI